MHARTSVHATPLENVWPAESFLPCSSAGWLKKLNKACRIAAWLAHLQLWQKKPERAAARRFPIHNVKQRTLFHPAPR